MRRTASESFSSHFAYATRARSSRESGRQGDRREGSGVFHRQRRVPHPFADGALFDQACGQQAFTELRDGGEKPGLDGEDVGEDLQAAVRRDGLTSRLRWPPRPLLRRELHDGEVLVLNGKLVNRGIELVSVYLVRAGLPPRWALLQEPQEVLIERLCGHLHLHRHSPTNLVGVRHNRS